MTLADLVGISWVVHGRSLEGIDCVGLAILAQEVLDGRKLIFAQDYDEGNIYEQSSIIRGEVVRLFAPVEVPHRGDVGLFFFESCWHLATFTDRTHFLHILEGQTSRISRLTPVYKRYMEGVYTWRER